jgi:hypothetical protein
LIPLNLMDDLEAWNERSKRMMAKLLQDLLRLQEESSRSLQQLNLSPEAKEWHAAMEIHRIRKLDPPLWRDVT